jgi:hypothetical protein
MAMHRKNKGPRSGQGKQPWFSANVKRQRNRKKIAKASRRKNRK